MEYSKLTVALEYLEAAIKEREIHQRSMNLAGVAEELFGKMVRVLGKIDQIIIPAASSGVFSGYFILMFSRIATGN